MTEIVAQTNIQAEVHVLAGDLAGEIDRLSGEINKHNQFEAAQLEELQRASAQGGSASSERTPKMKIETPEMETQRERNKEQLNTRRKDVTAFLRATEVFNAAENKDRGKAEEILADFHTLAVTLGGYKTKALALMDNYNLAFAELEKTVKVARDAVEQVDANLTRKMHNNTLQASWPDMKKSHRGWHT